MRPRTAPAGWCPRPDHQLSPHNLLHSLPTLVSLRTCVRGSGHGPRQKAELRNRRGTPGDARLLVTAPGSAAGTAGLGALPERALPPACPWPARHDAHCAGTSSETSPQGKQLLWAYFNIYLGRLTGPSHVTSERTRSWQLQHQSAPPCPACPSAPSGVPPVPRRTAGPAGVTADPGNAIQLAPAFRGPRTCNSRPVPRHQELSVRSSSSDTLTISGIFHRTADLLFSQYWPCLVYP